MTPRRLSLVAFLATLALGSVALATPETLRVFRLYSPTYGPHDHMESHDQYESAHLGFYAEAAYLFYANPQGANTPGPAHPIYRCLIWGWEHMDTGDPGCEGYGYVEATLGYALDGPAAGHVGLYRCRNDQARGEHFVSTDPGCEGRVTEHLLGYIRVDDTFTQTPLSGQNEDECLGRCGLGCSWMPWDAWTSECMAHDQCVANHGHLACLPQLIPAAISYVWAGAKSLVKTITNFVEDLFSWW